MSEDDNLSSNTSSSCDVKSLQLAVEREGSLNSIVERYRVGSWKKYPASSAFLLRQTREKPLRATVRPFEVTAVQRLGRIN